jgi:hypothetical protein
MYSALVNLPTWFVDSAEKLRVLRTQYENLPSPSPSALNPETERHLPLLKPKAQGAQGQPFCLRCLLIFNIPVQRTVSLYSMQHAVSVPVTIFQGGSPNHVGPWGVELR